MAVYYNTVSKIPKDKSKKYKCVTIHILEDHLEDFQRTLSIATTPRRQKKGDLLKNSPYGLLNLPDYENQETPIELNPVYQFFFATDEDREDVNTKLKISILKTTRSLWFPERPEHPNKGLMYICDEIVTPVYPVYILSKGRWKTRHTAKTLEEMKVPYKIVVEPQEYHNYKEVISDEKILILPDEYMNKNQGSIPARNFVWRHSIDNGHACHWVLDDNIEGFFRWNHNKRLPLKSGICFKQIEDYMNLHDNVAQCGIQYASMFPEISMARPVILTNTRIYSCILIKNNVDIEERWRGKFNEDTDLSIRLMKKGYSTILFQNYLCGKKTTLSVKGGNSQIYSGDGLKLKYESLKEQHPDIVSCVSRFSKEIHHQVDYTCFKNNSIVLRGNVIFLPSYPEIKLVPCNDITPEDEEEQEES